MINPVKVQAPFVSGTRRGMRSSKKLREWYCIFYIPIFGLARFIQRSFNVDYRSHSPGAVFREAYKRGAGSRRKAAVQNTGIKDYIFRADIDFVVLVCGSGRAYKYSESCSVRVPQT